MEKVNYIFVEEQKFNQLWLKILMILISIISPLIVLIPIYIEFKNGNLSYATNMSQLVFTIAVSLIFPILLQFLIWGAKLTVKIDIEGIHFKYFPFHLNWQLIKFNDIKEVYFRKYSPIGEYGGWGIRYGIMNKGKAYNVYGNLGVQFILKNNKKILIGSQNPENFVNAINQVQENQTNRI